METRFIQFDHTRLAVHIAGRGPLVALLHGYPLDHRMWLDVMTGPLAAEHTFAAIDLRGHGRSPWCGDAVHTMDLFADDVSAVIRTLGDDPVDVVGLSMGGYVAQALYEHHPQLVSSLALVDTKAPGDSPPQQQARDAAIAVVLRDGRRALAAAMTEKLLAPAAVGGPGHDLARARCHSMIEAQPVETIVADLRGLRDRPDRTAAMAAARVPVLVVHGEHDAIMPVAEAEAWARAIPGAGFARVPAAGHMPPIENADAFARALGGFWDAL